MKLRVRRKKGIRWYQRELKRIQQVADEALERYQKDSATEVAVGYGITLAAIVAMAADGAIGREAYLEP